MPPRESTEEEMRNDGIQRPKGNSYCKRCGYYYDNLEEFFDHHKAKHPWEDLEVLKAGMAEADKYIKWWMELIGLKNYEKKIGSVPHEELIGFADHLIISE
jgi:hypothetical protein